MTTAPDVSRSWSTTAINPVGGGTYVNTSGSDMIDRSYQPNYRALVEHGSWIPPLAYRRVRNFTSSTKVKNTNYNGNTSPAGTEEVVSVGNFSISDALTFGYIYRDPVGSQFTTADVDSQAVQNFYSNAKSLQFNLGVATAEAPQTFKLIGDTAFRLARAFRYLKKLQVTRAFRTLDYSNKNLLKKIKHKAKRRSSRRDPTKFAAESWLELQYGWKPLLSDVHAAAQDLGSRFSSKSVDIVVKGRCTKRNHWTYKKSVPLPGAISKFDNLSVFTMGSSFETTRIEYGGYYKVFSDTLRTASGLGLTNPLEIAWELLPFSFVVDWFVPVGSYLESLSTTQGMTWITGYKSQKFETQYGVGMAGGSNRFSKSSTTGRYFVFSGIATLKVDNFDFTRSILTSPPVNSKILRLKSLSQAFSGPHAANGLALLRAVFGR